MKNNQIFSHQIFFILKIKLMTSNTFLRMLFDENTILLFRRYYFHTRISIMKRELLFLHLISVCQISQNATTKFNSNGRKLWTRFVKFDTFVYSHYKPRYKCSIICSDWKQSFRVCDSLWYITLEFRWKFKEIDELW